MRRLMLTVGAIAALVAVSSAPEIASARPHHYHHYDRGYHRGCAHERHRSGAIGAVSGAVGGGIIGSAASHGHAGGTLLGAGLGALAGNAIGRSTVHC